MLNVAFTRVLGDAILRAIEVVPANPGNPTAVYLYRGNGLRYAKTEGGLPSTYTWDVNQGLPVVLQDGTNTYVYGLGLISQTGAGGNRH